MSSRVILIGCVAGKRDVDSPAQDLYVSPLFTARRRYAERSGHPWGVLSALYGTLRPDRVIRPYDWTIQKRLAAGNAAGSWAVGVIQGAYRLAGMETTLVDDGRDGYRVFAEPLTIEIHAGIDYVRTIRELGVPAFWRCAPLTIEHPVAGMGIGQQKHWYATRQPESIWRVLARRQSERTRA